MPIRPPLPWLIAFLIVTSIAMTVAASFADKRAAAGAAALFVTVIAASALATSAPLWRQELAGRVAESDVQGALSAGVLLAMLAYAWCGVTMLSIYLGASLRWQHGWQYGSAMLLIALGHAIYLKQLEEPGVGEARSRVLQNAAKLAAGHAILVAIGLIWLIASGKVASLKGDWAANQIFVAGGFAIICISMIIVKTYSALSRP